ncbi:MAG: LamG-like jellyroll fold domain-containing protein, partial [Patescibacteria group bacterium]
MPMAKIKKRKIKYGLLMIFFGFLFFGASVFFGANEVAAQDTFGLQPIASGVNLAGGDIRVTITNIIRIALGLLGIIAFVIVLYGGFVYMTANGEEDKIATAKKILINGVIGLAIILSAFAITQFIFQKLSEATGTGYVDPTDINPGICDLSNPNYDASKCNQLCVANPLLSLCEEQHFYIKSITPSTPVATDATKMNNIVARVIFSRKLAGDTDLAKSITIKNLNTGEITPIIVQTISGGEGNVLEARMASTTKLITNDFNQGYEIKVNPDLKDDVNGVLETNVNGKNYPLVATFRVDASAFVDNVKPTVGPVNILNSNNQSTNLLYIGDTFSVASIIKDRSEVISYGGNGLAYVQIVDMALPKTKLLYYYGGPGVITGSSADYLMLYNGIVSQNIFQPLHIYRAGVVGFDIDSNISSASAVFTVFGKSCNNKIKDDDETGVDTGGSCGSIGSCTVTSPCASGYLCVEGQCKAQPMIKEIAPMNGASGNWITIYGSNFGTAAGKIEFASKNANGTYRPWVSADVISCQGQASWHDDWVVAEVPVSGYLDSAVEIGPAKGSLRIPTNPALDISGQLTLEAWVKTADMGGYKIIMSKKGSYYLALNKLRPAVYLAGTAKPGWHMMNTAIPANVWTHLAIAYDGGKVNFFVNGKKQSYVGVTSGNINSVPGESLWLGDRIDFSNTWLNGQIDEAAVYNSVLSEQVLLNHYNAKDTSSAYESAVLADKPVGFWRLGEASGTVALDSGLNKINGTYAGAVKLGVESVFGSTLTLLKGGNQIKLTSGDDPTLSDTTIDDFGPKPLPEFASVQEKSDYLLVNDPGLFMVNDIKRPGLCKVAVSEQKTFQVGDVSYVSNVGDLAAPPKTPVAAVGTGFGAVKNTSNIKFSVKNAYGALLPGLIGDVNGWSDKEILTSVPLNLVGDTAVYATVQNEKSNSVKFTVISDKDFKVLPTIAAIDPVSTTRNSYITISGTGFGEYLGRIFVADSIQHTQSCVGPVAGQHTSCQELAVSLPAQCGNTWSDTQIIAQVPENATIGKFFLILQRGDAAKLKSSGVDQFEIKAGNPRPGICLLDPSQGPAPLPSDNIEGLSLYGQNFSSEPLVYFQGQKTKLDDLSTWLVSAETDFIIKDDIAQKNNNKIQTKIPVDLSDGSSMVTGFIKVKSDKEEVSNRVKYTVEDCRQTAGAPEGLHCCKEGADAGLWKLNSYTCDGETREAGYVWRFASGVISDNPRVVEQCDEAKWNDTTGSVAYPSPTPWDKRKNGKNACLNSSIVARFSLPMKASTLLTGDNVRVYRCADKDGVIDCANKVANELKDLSLKIQTGVDTTLIIRSGSQGNLAANTWYHVELTDKILSSEFKSVLGQPTYLERPLQKTKPCGINPDGEETAYCFDFKTGTETCKLTAAGINPPNYLANYLGTLFNPQFPPAAGADPFNITNPLYYFVWGRGDQECSVLDVDGLGWQWDADPGVTELNKKAKAFAAPSDAPGAVYKDSRATVDAKQNTYPDSVLVRAETTVQNSLMTNIGGIDLLQLAGKDKGYKQENNQKVNIDSTISENAIVNLSSSFTLEIKYKLDKLVNFVSDVIYKKDAYSFRYYAGGGKDLGLCLTSSLIVSSPATTICAHDPIKSAPVIGEVNHYIYTYDSVTKKIKLYGDGKLLGEKTIGDFPQNINPLVLGGNPFPVDVTYDALRIRPDILDESLIISILNSDAESTLIRAESDLTIDLGDPQVSYYEPDCIESCVNPSIKVSFTRQMDESTYAGNYEIYKCFDSNCVDSQMMPGLFAIDGSSSDNNNLVLTLPGSNVLDTSTYYKVVLNGNITAIGGIIPAVGEGEPTIIPGKHLKPFVWYFKTQSNSTPCAANYFKLSPILVKASMLGEKSEINATPYSSPNSCSKYGQALNKWQFGYNWTVEDTNVATVSNFDSAYGWKSYCTESCLPAGSDIRSDIAIPISVCGNGLKENGEDCDIGVVGEVGGVSCTLNCLRPGNNQKVETATPTDEVNKCGNGTVETAVGEQCDPGASLTTNNTVASDLYCSDVCLLKGSNPPVAGEKSTQAEGNDLGAQKPSVC